ncbi:hypothetical protein Zmor_004225 [Zophobas morio]|uniref:Uncharacterized protein n=1 Tax=Zophobas morio TaxID=2755281 RepID=A0AA38HJ47_9CUCU|nr:hypothetical protein Zmor_004225 [Zophobas morio]
MGDLIALKIVLQALLQANNIVPQSYLFSLQLVILIISDLWAHAEKHNHKVATVSLAVFIFSCSDALLSKTLCSSLTNTMSKAEEFIVAVLL